MTNDDIFKMLMEEMEADNMCNFTATKEQRERALSAINVMVSTGFKFTREVCQTMTAGEATKMDDLFGSIAGYPELNEILNEIFNS